MHPVSAQPKFGRLYELTIQDTRGTRLGPHPAHGYLVKNDYGKELINSIASLMGGFRGGFSEGYDVFWSGNRVVIAANDRIDDEHTETRQALNDVAWGGSHLDLEQRNAFVENFIERRLDRQGYIPVQLVVKPEAFGTGENPFHSFTMKKPVSGWRD